MSSLLAALLQINVIPWAGLLLSQMDKLDKSPPPQRYLMFVNLRQLECGHKTVVICTSSGSVTDASAAKWYSGGTVGTERSLCPESLQSNPFPESLITFTLTPTLKGTVSQFVSFLVIFSSRIFLFHGQKFMVLGEVRFSGTQE